jgi:type II secretory pathway component GspD/PulD (secretin)
VDAKLDAFIFRGSAADIGKLVKLLDQVDVAQGEVVVRAVVYEVRRSATDASALSIVGELLKSKVGIQFGAAVAGNTLSIAFGGFRALASALATDARFRQVSAPNVRVRSGETARFTVGNETPVLGSVTTTQGGSAVQSIDYRPSGVILDIVPIVRQDQIEVKVNQQISSFTTTTSGVNNSPTLLKRELLTTLGVAPGETIVMAGLEDSRRNQDRTGLTFLPRWLDSKGETEDATEVLLVLDVQRVTPIAVTPKASTGSE